MKVYGNRINQKGYWLPVQDVTDAQYKIFESIEDYVASVGN